MAKNVVAPGHEILEAALQGLEAQRTKLDEQIGHVRALLRQTGKKPSKAFAPVIPISAPITGAKRILSPEARKRIAAAQKKRWAAFRKNQK